MGVPAIRSPGLGDLAPDATMKWAFGVHYFTAYVTANVPIGQFSGSRLANIGIGHWAVDAGGGYTYFDPKTGYEFSGVLGFTYNFINPTTQYQDGVDMHFDWAASYTFNDKISAGVVGYVFRQTQLRHRVWRHRWLQRVAGLRRWPAGDLQFPGQ